MDRRIGLSALTSWLLAAYFAVVAGCLDRDVYGDQYHALVVLCGVVAGAFVVPGTVYGLVFLRQRDQAILAAEARREAEERDEAQEGPSTS